MKTRRLVALVTAAAVAALSLSGSSGAIPRQRVVAAALAALKPAALKSPVVVYGLPAPLPAGTDVVEPAPRGRPRPIGPGGRSTGPARYWHLRRKAWLFWEDLAPGALFVHPSRLVLVDDATAKVTVLADLGWYPLVDGKPPPFLRRPTAARYWVYSKTPRKRSLSASGQRLRSLQRRVQPHRPAATTLTGERDCFVYATDAGDQSPASTYMKANVAAMNAWADSHHAQHDSTNRPSSDALAARIKELTDAGCNDVVVYLEGHGEPRPGQVVDLGNGQKKKVPENAGSKVAAVTVDTTVTPGPGGGWQVKKVQITSNDIADIVKGYVAKGPDGKPIARVHFKLIVDSCFAGRFIDDLAPLWKDDPDHPDPPIRTIAASSSADRVTNQDILFAGKAPAPRGHWITALLQGFMKVEGNESLTREDAGDLAAIIADAARAADDAANRTGGDKIVRDNNPQTTFSPGTIHPRGEPREPVPEVDVRPIQAFFTQSLRHTTYTIYAKPDPLTYSWTLHPPTDPKGCNNGGELSSTADTFVWYHGDDQCTHALEDDAWGHRGTVEVTVTLKGYVCHASIYGTNTGLGEPPRPMSLPPNCRRV